MNECPDGGCGKYPDCDCGRRKSDVPPERIKSETTMPPEIMLPPGWLDAAIKRANEGPPSHGWPLRRVFETEKQ